MPINANESKPTTFMKKAAGSVYEWSGIGMIVNSCHKGEASPEAKAAGRAIVAVLTVPGPGMIAAEK